MAKKKTRERSTWNADSSVEMKITLDSTECLRQLEALEKRVNRVAARMTRALRKATSGRALAAALREHRASTGMGAL